jgi:hypothetical protein
VLPNLKAFRSYESRFFTLFALLLLAMLSLPYMAKVRALPTIAFIAIPLAGIYASSYTKRRLILAIILGIPAILTSAAVNLQTGLIPAAVAHISAAAFYGLTAASILEFVLREERIRADTIYGAMSVYLLIAFTWGFAYMTIDTINPGSFYFNPAHFADGVLEAGDYVYFSFVTLTTLGYGDMVPIKEHARVAAVTEAVCGVLFTATLIAGLVGRLGTRHK